MVLKYNKNLLNIIINKSSLRYKIMEYKPNE